MVVTGRWLKELFVRFDGNDAVKWLLLGATQYSRLLQALIMVLDSPERPQHQIRSQAELFAENPTREGLRELWLRGGYAAVTSIRAQRKEVLLICDEILRHAIDRWGDFDAIGRLLRDREGIANIHGVGGVLLTGIVVERFLLDLHRELKQADRRARLYLKGANQPEEHLAAARAGALEAWERATQECRNMIPARIDLPPVLSPPPPTVTPGRWDWPAINGEIIGAQWSGWAAVLLFEQKIADAAHQAVRTHLAQDKRRGGREANQVAAFIDIGDAGDYYEPGDALSNAWAGQGDLEGRIAAAFPPKVAEYFIARQDRNQEEAARKVGVTPRTARNYEHSYGPRLRDLLRQR